MGPRVIGLGADREIAVHRRFLDDQPVPWPVLYAGQGDLLERFGVDRFPTYVLLDREGTVIAADAELEGLAEQIRALVAER